MEIIVWTTIVLSVLCHTGIIVAIFFLCKPMAYYWDLGLTIKNGTCGSDHYLQMAKFIPGLISLLFDIVIFVYVNPILSGLWPELTSWIEYHYRFYGHSG